MQEVITTPVVPEGHLLRPDVVPPGLAFVAGDGVELVTESGDRVFDAISGVGVTCLGYTVPAIVDAMAEQARTLPYLHAMRFETPVLRELGERLARLTPAGLNFAFFVSGGSEAVESAIKLARQYWLERDEPGKWRIVGRWPSFHGNTIAALAAGWHRARRLRHQPLLLDFPHIEAPNSYRGCGHCRDEGSCTLGCAEELERVLIREGASTVAAFIAEPIVGAAGGAFVPHPEYFPLVREICDRHDVLLIADEVITGFGRTGAWFAVDHWSVEPDVIVFAKGVSAGFAPLGGLAIRDSVVAAFSAGSGRFEHNFTMAGHPVACAAGCAALEEFERIDAPARVRDLEGPFFESLNGLRDARLVGDIRGKGLLAGIELVADKTTKQPFEPNLAVAERVARRALAEGVLVYPCTGAADGIGDHLLLMPAFVMPPELFVELARRLRRAMDNVAVDLGLEG
jgi:adenosylmethionine-8-amino-7-oxononanoate aminotransferase